MPLFVYAFPVTGDDPLLHIGVSELASPALQVTYYTMHIMAFRT